MILKLKKKLSERCRFINYSKFVYFQDTNIITGTSTAMNIFVLKWMLHILYYSFVYDFIYFLLFVMVLVDLLLMDDEEEIGDEDFI